MMNTIPSFACRNRVKMQSHRDISYSLISAVREGKLERVEELISNFGLSYSPEWSDGYVLLCDALKNRHSKVAKLLITSGSKVNSKNAKYFETPLYLAIKNGDVEIVEMLLDNGASTDVKSYGHRTPLHNAILYESTTPLHDAVLYGYTHDAERQVEHRANVDAQSKNDIRILRSSVTNCGIKIVKMLLDRGVNIEVKCERGYTPLFYAVANGYVNGVKLLLQYGANVNAQRDLHSETILYKAIIKGNLLIVEHLIQHGASVNPVNTDFHKQPLYTAIYWKHEEIVKLLLECGANINAQDEYGNTILHFAVARQRLVIVEHILKHCPDVNNKGNRSALNIAMCRHGKGNSKIFEKLLEYGFIVDFEYENNGNFLHDAVQNGYFKIVEQLLKYGTDVNALYDSTSRERCTPLHVAIKNKREQEAKLLISYDADINAKDILVATPICYAIGNDCREIVEILLEHGADVNNTDKYSRTALHFTAVNIYNNLLESHFTTVPDISVKGEIAKLLLRRGANVNAQAENGITTLHAASGQGYVKLVEALLEYNADVNCTDKIHRTPLHFASENCNLEIVEILLKFGAAVDSKDKSGRTPLHFVSDSRGSKWWNFKIRLSVATDRYKIKRYAETVKILLKFGASIDSTDEHGRTALHNASKNRNLEIVQILLKFGTSIDSKDKGGRTALHIASEENHIEIVKILLKFGASTDFIDEHGRTALHIASEEKHAEIVKILLRFGASTDFIDEHGRTALHIASEEKHAEIVKILLRFGASTDSKDDHGRTALYIASEKCHLEIAKILLNFGASTDSIDEHGRTALYIPCGMQFEAFVVALLEHGSDITIMINSICKLNLDHYNCYYCQRSYPGYGFCDHRVGKNIAEILKRHMIKVKIANLYASNKDLLSISSNDDLSDFELECEKEVVSMKSEKVGNSDTSFYDILTKGTSQLAIYAGNETIVQVFRSDDYKKKFPIYATMINNHYRKGERRKPLMEQGNKIFHFLFTNFLGIPYDCIGKILTYLSDDDLRCIMVACKPISVRSPNTDNN